MSIEDENEKAREDFAARMRGEIPEEKQGRKVSSGDSVEDSREKFAERMRTQGEKIVRRENARQNDEGEEKDYPAAVEHDNTEDGVKAAKNAFAARMRGEKEHQQDQRERRQKKYGETAPVQFDSREVVREYRAQRAAVGLEN